MDSTWQGSQSQPSRTGGNRPPTAPGRAARLCLAACLCVALLPPTAAAATIYKWVDNAGVTHFTSDPPPDGVDAERIEVESGKRRFGSAPSARLKQIRCRDFRGALDQLEATQVAPGERDQWRAAKDKARAGVEKWCPQ